MQLGRPDPNFREIAVKPQKPIDPATILLIRPTLKIPGGTISVFRVGEDLSETEVRKLHVTGSPDHEWPGLVTLVEQEMGNGHQRFIVDLRQVPWMNSRGLGRLIELWNLIETAGGQAALVCAPGRIRNILQISQVDLLMKPVLDVAAAVRKISAT